MIKLKKLLILTAAVAFSNTITAAAQQNNVENDNLIVIQPLFEYPTAPEEIEDLAGKSNFLMEHFWDDMNFKSKKAVDQAALNDAFSVYTVPMQFADKNAVMNSVNTLIKRISKNPALLLQFTTAAEEALYGNRARFWIDEVYIPFLEAIDKDKKIPDIRKVRFRRQLNILKNSAIGNRAPQFDFEGIDGNKRKYFPMSTPTLIEFGDPSCDECRHTRLRLEANAALTEAVNAGKVNILFIIPSPSESWALETAGYPSKWTVGASEDVDDIYDLRLSPSLYVIDGTGTIIAKNIDVTTAISTLLNTSSASKTENNITR